MKLTFFQPNFKTGEKIPLVSSSVKAGFPSVADNFLEKNLDLNELLVSHPAATFFVRVDGDSMEEAKISDGDILIVDRAVEATHGKIVIAILNGEFTVKRIKVENEEITLMPENPKYPPLKITGEMDFSIWGVVTHIIHKCSS